MNSKIYVINFGKGVKLLCFDERRRGIRKLPGRGASVEEVKAMCEEINILRTKMSWGEIADIYGVKRDTLCSFYYRKCRNTF